MDVAYFAEMITSPKIKKSMKSGLRISTTSDSSICATLLKKNDITNQLHKTCMKDFCRIFAT